MLKKICGLWKHGAEILLPRLMLNKMDLVTDAKEITNVISEIKQINNITVDFNSLF